MATPNRQAILDDVYATLGSLLLGLLPPPADDQTSKVTIKTLERCLKTWSEVGANQFPWLGFGGVTSDFIHEPGGLLYVLLKFRVLAHVASTPPSFDQITVDLAAIEDDVIAALNVSTTRSGLCLDTKILHTESSEGEPSPTDSRGAIGSIAMDFVCKYQRTVNAT